MKSEIYSCDVCKQPINEPPKDKAQEQIQVIFLTEQTEGRSCKPYLSLEKMDICHNCKSKILNGNMLYGQGAQGYN